MNEIGLEPLMTELLERIIKPLAILLFPQEFFSSSLDHHHSFVVEYNRRILGGDVGLDMHSDASEITLNINLGRDFTKGGLRFCGHAGGSDLRKEQYHHEHRVGQAVLHLGRHRHGADDIEEGDRINLIVWAKSSTFRAAAAAGVCMPDGFPRSAESGLPDLMCLSRTNDEDYLEKVALVSGSGLEAF